MADTEEKVIEKKEEVKEPEVLQLRRKSLLQIAKEGADLDRKADEERIKETLKQKSEEKPVKEDKDEEKQKEVKEEKPKKEPKPKIDPEEIATKAREEAARVAEETTKKAFEKETQRILDQNKSLEEKQKEQDELISVWDKEERLPKDYKEIVAESLRISEAKYKQLKRQDEETAKKADEERKKSEDFKKSETERIQQARIDEINTKVKTDLDDLYTAKILPKPPTEYDEKNEDQKKTDDLMKFGIELNTERAKKGLPPVDSIAKIYFLHYKPKIDLEGAQDNQPAGADAPVSGSATPQAKSDNDRYIYARDHNKSFQQLAMESAQRLKK